MSQVAHNPMLFKPELVEMVNLKIQVCEISAPYDFDIEYIREYRSEYNMDLSFNLDDNLARVDFFLNVVSESEVELEEEAIGNFEFSFIYKIENMHELAFLDKGKMLSINPMLANALASISFSTSRGLLFSRCQGTALDYFVLPVINPGLLLQKNG